MFMEIRAMKVNSIYQDKYLNLIDSKDFNCNRTIGEYSFLMFQVVSKLKHLIMIGEDFVTMASTQRKLMLFVVRLGLF